VGGEGTGVEPYMKYFGGYEGELQNAWRTETKAGGMALDWEVESVSIGKKIHTGEESDAEKEGYRKGRERGDVNP